MKLAILYLVIIGLLLTGMSYVYQLMPPAYTAEDNQFAHEEAQRLLREMEQIQQEATNLDGTVKPLRADVYLVGQERFIREKQATVHYKRELAEDFTYACALAEGWCRYAAAALLRGGSADQESAEAFYRKARQELQTIAGKEYDK